MPRIVQRHFPVITARLRFNPIYQQTHPRPVITVRINFTERLEITSHQHLPSDQPSAPESRERSRSQRPSVTHCQSPNNSAEDSPSSENQLHHTTSVNTDVDDDDGELVLIPKPPGEPGRPRSGGYNLQEQLTGWTADLYDDIKMFVQTAATRNLDETRSYSHQDQKLIKAVCGEAAKEYPILLKYRDVWPVSDMLKAHLKYTSEQARKKQDLRRDERRFMRTSK